MAEKNRPLRTNSQAIPSTPGKKAKADSGQARTGSDEFYINDAGEVCIGTGCFSLRFKPGEREVRVNIDRNQCGADMQPFIDALYQELGQGAPTVYGTESKIQERWEELTRRIKAWPRPRPADAQRFLEDMGKAGIEVTGLDDALELLQAYRDITREDFDTSEEYSEARADAWQEFLDALDEVQLELA